jgi:hypothetical protein
MISIAGMIRGINGLIFKNHFFEYFVEKKKRGRGKRAHATACRRAGIVDFHRQWYFHPVPAFLRLYGSDAITNMLTAKPYRVAPAQARDAVRLYSRWRVEPPNAAAPTLGFRTLKVSLSGICDLVAAYKNEPLPLAVHDELWTLLDDMKLKAELAIDPSYATGARCLDALIQDRRTSSDRGTADTTRATLAPNDKPELWNRTSGCP